MTEMIEQLADALNAHAVFGNSYMDYAVAGGVALAGFAVLWIVKTIGLRFAGNLAGRTITRLDDGMVELTGKYLMPPLYLGVICGALHLLELSEGAWDVVNVTAAVLFTFFGVRLVLGVVRFLLVDYWLGKRDDREHLTGQIEAMMPLVGFVVWLTGIIFLVDNLGFDIGAVVAGLGIGGVAVALAASAVLGDLFAYITIMFDRPFKIGDFVIVGDFMGAIESIGLKSTKIRSLGGEQVIFSNKALTDSRIRNYKRMERRRVVFKVGVTYGTSLEELREVPGLIEEIITLVEDTVFDRAHFSSFADSALEMEVVYYVMGADYNKYMDIQQAINLRIKEAFEARGIDFAFPTRTLHLVRTDGHPVPGS